MSSLSSTSTQGQLSLDTPLSASLPKKAVKVQYVTDIYGQIELLVAPAKPLVEMEPKASLKDVTPLIPSHTPLLPAHLLDATQENGLSSLQLESVIRAGTAHSEVLLGGEHGGRPKGFFIGDQTGQEATRQAAAIIQDNLEHGRTIAVWIAASNTFFTEFQQDIASVGGNTSKIKKLATLPNKGAVIEEGIIFTSDAELRKKSTPEALVAACGGSNFNGVVVLESLSGLVRGAHGPGIDTLERHDTVLRRQAIVKLQHLLPNARFVYVAHTEDGESPNLAVAQRLTTQSDLQKMPPGKTEAELARLGVYVARVPVTKQAGGLKTGQDKSPEKVEPDFSTNKIFRHLIEYKLSPELETQTLAYLGKVPATFYPRPYAEALYELREERLALCAALEQSPKTPRELNNNKLKQLCTGYVELFIEKQDLKGASALAASFQSYTSYKHSPDSPLSNTARDLVFRVIKERTT